MHTHILYIFKGSVGSKTSYFSKTINLAPSEIVDSVAYVSSSSKNMSMTDLYWWLCYLHCHHRLPLYSGSASSVPISCLKWDKVLLEQGVKLQLNFLIAVSTGKPLRNIVVPLCVRYVSVFSRLPWQSFHQSAWSCEHFLTSCRLSFLWCKGSGVCLSSF